MYIYNLKINSSVIFKIVFFITILVVVVLCVLVGLRIYKESISEDSDIKKCNYIEVTNKNYANILKSVHDNIDSYVGKKIKYSGFVYRVYDLNSKQFILGRNMIISSDMQTVVVGFLCNCSDAVLYKDSQWVEIEGKIIKDKYQGSDMPILEIISIKEMEKPNDEYVYPPDEYFVPTADL